MQKKYLSIILFISLILASISGAQSIILGKVVGIADGDTITVLQNRTQYKIRLYGIDTPERAQDFGKKAKQFTSNMVFGKHVRVVKEDMDRYGRVVGTVYVDGVCVNEEIIKDGFAWVYRKYCKSPVCAHWLKLEETARLNRIGLWSHKDPIEPWNYRRGER